MSSDEKYMRRCFELASNGLGTTYPNPLVGSVIVKDGRVLSEGWHRSAGNAHAERMAVDRIDSPSDLVGATVYVNLEPCSHYGRTPPCADLLVASNIGRVVISNTDPNPEVSGRGIERLRNAGIEVLAGVLESEGEWLNRRFFCLHRTRKPYVILKWAESQDGFIDGIRNGSVGSMAISGKESSRWVHQWRSQENAIAVGKTTVINDNPSLTTRRWAGNDPTPIIFAFREDVSDRKLLENPSALWLNDLGFDRENGKPEWSAILHALGKKGISSLFVEGGRYVLESLLAAGEWNEIRRFISKERKVGRGLRAPSLDLAPAERFENKDDYLIIYNSSL